MICTGRSNYDSFKGENNTPLENSLYCGSLGESWSLRSKGDLGLV